MQTETARRAAIAIVVGLALVVAACSNDAGDHDTASGEAPSLTQAQLRGDMRELWEDHVTWTRVVIISAAADLPDFQPAVARLLQNQDDIGNAIKPFYGDAAGTELTRLLKDHIAIAGELLVAARAGDAVAQEDAGARWYANADDIGRFLSRANPDHWAEPEMTQMMRTHLDLTLEEATARLTGDWVGDVVAYDRVVAEIRHMSDMLADGIIAQFPDQFA